jgi:hypothetical protein
MAGQVVSIKRTLFHREDEGIKKMQHKATLRKTGPERFVLKCTCGRIWTGYRFFVEEQFTEHLPAPEPEPVYPLWYDDASYARYQAGNNTNWADTEPEREPRMDINCRQCNYMDVDEAGQAMCVKMDAGWPIGCPYQRNTVPSK